MVSWISGPSSNEPPRNPAIIVKDVIKGCNPMEGISIREIYDLTGISLVQIDTYIGCWREIGKIVYRADNEGIQFFKFAEPEVITSVRIML